MPTLCLVFLLYWKQKFRFVLLKGVRSLKQLYVVIKGPFDSKKLWSLIERYKVNLTDLGDKVLVYGDVTFQQSVDIIAFCAMFGDILESNVG